VKRPRLPRLFRTLQGRLTAIFVLAATILVAAGSLLLMADQSRNDDALLTKTLRTRIDRIVEEVNRTGTLPNTEVYAQIITMFGSVRDLTPTLAKEYLLTNEQLNFVFRAGQLQIDRRLPTLPGTGRLLAQKRQINGTPVVIVVGASRELERLSRRRLLATLGIAGPLLVALLGLAGWVLTGAALRPVRRLADEASAISRADTGRRLPLPRGSQEIRHLGETLNAMLDRLAASFARERSFVDDASHELRTPLAILRGELELATLHPNRPDDTMRALYSAIDEVDRLSALADQLLVLARSGSASVSGPGSDAETRRARCSVMEVVPATVDRLRPTLPTELTLTLDGTCDGSIALNPEQLAQILTNLVTNAARFAHNRVLMKIDRQMEPAGPSLVLQVHDDGPGFDDTILPTAFERFTLADRARTRKVATGGAGLGLAIVRSLTESAHGTARARNGSELGGAVVEIRVPLLTRMTNGAGGNGVSAVADRRDGAAHSGVVSAL
jgi:two-component system, OmpR family, sensor kinase